MNTRFIVYLSAFLLFGCSEQPLIEKSPVLPLNFEAAKSYFSLVEKLQQGDSIPEKDWVDFFNVEGNRIYLEYYKYTQEDMESIKESITITYQPEKEHLVSPERLDEIRSSYRNRYKKNHQPYKDYLTFIERNQVAFADSMMTRAKAFLPKDFMIYRKMPTVYYHALTPGGKSTYHNQLFISVLGSYESSRGRMASMEAHELHHNLRPDLSYALTKPDSSYYQIIIEEADKTVYDALTLALNEGLADMIDLDLLFADTSKWWKKDELRPLLTLEGERVVKKLNENFIEAANGTIQDWSVYHSLYMEDNGHIPGYFMAKAIKDHGRLAHIIEHAADPFAFFLTYQEVALQDEQLPVFDEVVVSYLKRLQKKYLDKLALRRNSFSNPNRVK